MRSRDKEPSSPAVSQDTQYLKATASKYDKDLVPRVRWPEGKVLRTGL